MKKINFFLFFMLITLLTLFSNASYSAMFVYPMELSVGFKGSSQLKVYSQDEDTQFIKVKVKKIINPGTKSEIEQELNAEAGISNELIVTPQKIALPSYSERLVRVISLMPPKNETAWRVYFESVNESNFIKQEISDGVGGASASIGVNIIWGALIHIAPESISPSLKINPSGEKIFNDGTIRMPIQEIGECDKDGQCTWRKLQLTIYPDTEVKISRVALSPSISYRVKYLNWITNKQEEIPLTIQR